MTTESQRKIVEGLTLLIDEHLKIASEASNDEDVMNNLEIVQSGFQTAKKLEYFPMDKLDEFENRYNKIYTEPNGLYDQFLSLLASGIPHK